jgi:hypothetical protein
VPSPRRTSPDLNSNLLKGAWSPSEMAGRPFSVVIARRAARLFHSLHSLNVHLTLTEAPDYPILAS